jgi:hypothetical protein
MDMEVAGLDSMRGENQVRDLNFPISTLYFRKETFLDYGRDRKGVVQVGRKIGYTFQREIRSNPTPSKKHKIQSNNDCTQE